LLPSQKITEEELRDLILDYVGKHSFKEHYAKDKYMDDDYYDGYGEYSKGKDVEELWELIPVVPSSCAAVLIEELPISAGLSDDIPQNLLKNNLEEGQIELLFNRKDVDLENIRKAIFFDESKGDNVRCAAVCVNFNLSYEEFSKILSYEKEKKDKYLDLLDCANDLSLPIWNAVKEIRESEHIFGDIHTRQYYAGHIDNRFKELPDYSRREQILDLRLYTLAKEIVPWDKSTKREMLSDDLSFLSKGVKDNTWQTFLNFRKIWRENRRSSKDERLLSQHEAFS